MGLVELHDFADELFLLLALYYDQEDELEEFDHIGRVSLPRDVAQQHVVDPLVRDLQGVAEVGLDRLLEPLQVAQFQRPVVLHVEVDERDVKSFSRTAWRLHGAEQFEK